MGKGREQAVTAGKGTLTGTGREQAAMTTAGEGTLTGKGREPGGKQRWHYYLGIIAIIK